MKKKIKKTEPIQDENPKKKIRFFESRFLQAAVIIFIGFLAYSNTFDVPFQWDDFRFIKENPSIKNISYFLEHHNAIYAEFYNHFKRRYLTYLTFAFNYKLHGFNVAGYHIINLSIHILNALLVYFLVNLIYKTPFLEKTGLQPLSKHIAFFTALFFVSHPLQTMAVTYIYQRLSSLVTLFYLMSITSYMQSRLSKENTTQWIFYAVSFIFAVLAMKTKENAVTLPVIIAIFEFSFFTGPLKSRISRLIPIFLCIFIIPLTLLDFGKPTGEMLDSATRGSNNPIGRTEYFLTQLSVILTYVRLLFLPIDQRLIYDFPLSRSFFDIKVILSFLSLTGIFSFAIYLFQRSRVINYDLRLIAFGIFWFFITLSIESSFIPLSMIAQEHRVYLPSVGAFFAIISGFFFFFNKIKERKVQKAFLSALILLPLVLSSLTYSRNIIWQSNISLWEDTVRKTPNNAMGNTNLGHSYSTQNLWDKAIEYLEIGIKLGPNNPMGHNSLGYAYRSKGLVDKAIEHLLIAVRLDPNMFQAHHNLALAYQSKGLYDKATEHFKNALRLNPELAEAHYNLANNYQSKGFYDKAIEHLQKALQLKPDTAKLHYDLAFSYYSKGLDDKAMEHLLIATRIKPDMFEAHYQLASAYQYKGLHDKAIEYYPAILGEQRIGANFDRT